MSFFSKLFRKANPDPTREFPPLSIPLPLTWNTATTSLSGIPLGSPVESLKALGPCSKFVRYSDVNFGLHYHQLGLVLEFELSRLEYVTFIFSGEYYGRPEDEDKLKPATPVVQPEGLALSTDSDPATLTRLFGPFEVMDKDEEELVGTFKNGKLCGEAEFNAQAKLVSLMIYRDE